MSEENTLTSAKSRTRSPAYPSIGLEEAIRKAEVLHENEDHHRIPVDVVAEHWEMAKKSSAHVQGISALKQFGLLVDEGAKENRLVKLTDLALDILLGDEASDKRKDAIKTCALSPKIHRELWDKYDGRLPAADQSIRFYLLRERPDVKFNKNYVDDFIGQFRSTLAFAGLISSDITAPAGGDTPSKESERFMDKTQPSKLIAVPTTCQRSPDIKEGPFIFFPLPDGNAVEIRLRAKLSPETFETVKKLLELSEASLVEKAQ